MSDSSIIFRVAAKGDGVTADGVHVAGGLPGDRVMPDGTLEPGPHHATPPCRHFRSCGGCQLQHADEAVLAAFVRDRVVNAALGQGLALGEELPVHLSPAGARRRATLHALRTAAGAAVGFREAGSHRIVDLRECPVIAPPLAALVAPLRTYIAQHGPRQAVDARLALCDLGIDLELANFPLSGLGPTEALLDFARHHGLARMSVDQGYGAECLWEPEPVTVTLSGHAVPLPPGAFLQATRDAEARMIADARSWLSGCATIADLFAGLGTFAFALCDTARVLAAEADQAAHLACKVAAGPAAGRAGGSAGGKVFPVHRDLFRNPVQASELARFDAVLLDPPRAGARAQVAEIAASPLSRVVYISCNPSSWARDAAVLVASGFRLTKLRPFGQFRWSTHVELTSLFER